MQDPLITPPPRKECPNFKAEPFSTGFLIQYISFKTYILGKNIAGDKQKVAFKGIHDDKLHINFKKAQYGFQSDASCNGRYTLCFIFEISHHLKNMLSKDSISYTVVYFHYLTAMSQKYTD